jgi:hypothetical protein
MQNNNTAIILDDLQIAQVEALANYLPIEQVAGYFNISVSEFLDLQKKDKRVLRAYRQGKIRGVCKVATLLWQQMEAGNVTAIIFFLKTRGGWSERPFAETEDNAHKFKNIKLICKEFETKKAKERMQATQFKEVDIRGSLLIGYPEKGLEQANDLKGKNLEVIAKKASVSRATAEQYDTIQRKGTEEQKAEVASGNSSIKKVYTSISKTERLETLSYKRRSTDLFIPIPLGVIVTKKATEVMARL